VNDIFYPLNGDMVYIKGGVMVTLAIKIALNDSVIPYKA